MNAEQQARLRVAVGRNAERYLRVFERIAGKGRWAPGWNMAAFLHSTGWFCYRRMFGWAVVNLLAPFFLIVLMFALGFLGQAVAPGANLDTAYWVLAGAYLLVVFVLLPVFADSLYYRGLMKRLADPQAPPRPPSAWTGLGALVFGAFWFAIVLAMSKPQYAEYTPRAKLSEAILAASSMRTEITEFYQNNGRLPNAEEAARFRIEGTAAPWKFAESVIYEPQNRRIVVTLREVFPGKRIALRVEERSGDFRWTCGPIDNLDKKQLPMSCRE